MPETPVILSDSIKAFQDGSAYAPAPGMSELASIGLEAATSAADTIAETWSAVTKNLSTTLSVTSSQVTVIELEAKSQGREPTEEELDEACGPLGVLVKVPNALSEALGDIFGQVNEFASDFGQTIASFANDLNTLINDVANAVDEVAQEIAQAVLDVFNTVNAVAIQALNAVEGAINSVVGFVNDAVAEAERLLNAAIDKLLGFADSLVVSALYKLECQEVAIENGIDADKVADAAEVDRVLSPTVERESTPPTENLADIPVTAPTLPEPQTTLVPKTNREQLITYWIDPTDKAAGTAIITFLSLKDATNLSAKNQEPFGEPVRVRIAGVPTRKTLLIRDNTTGTLYVVLANPELTIPEWEFYTIAAYARDLKQTVGPKTRSRDGVIVPDPNVSIEEPTLVPIPVDTSEIISPDTVEEFIQLTKRLISTYTQRNEETFLSMQALRSQEAPVLPDQWKALGVEVENNVNYRAAIINGINARSPADAKAIREAVGTIPPVLR